MLPLPSAQYTPQNPKGTHTCALCSTKVSHLEMHLNRNHDLEPSKGLPYLEAMLRSSCSRRKKLEEKYVKLTYESGALLHIDLRQKLSHIKKDKLLPEVFTPSATEEEKANKEVISCLKTRRTLSQDDWDILEDYRIS